MENGCNPGSNPGGGVNILKQNIRNNHNKAYKKVLIVLSMYLIPLSNVNSVIIKDGVVHKSYTEYSKLNKISNFFSRKKNKSGLERYSREKETSLFLFSQGLDVPHLLQADEENLVLTFRFQQFTNAKQFLTTYPQDFSKLMPKIVESLRKVHEYITHGSPYLKNFGVKSNHNIYTLDLEEEREFKEPKTLDLVILSADLLSTIKISGNERSKILKEIGAVYGEFNPITPEFRDHLFYRLCMGMNREFLDFFS